MSKQVRRSVAKAEAQDPPETLPAWPDEEAVETTREWLESLTEDRHLTPTGKRLASYFAAHPRFASTSSASVVAEQLGANIASVVRFVQGLGFKGWPDFQSHFRHRYYLGTLLPSQLLQERAPVESGASVFEEVLLHDISNLQAALATTDFSQGQAIAEAIANADKTLVVSSGSYAAVGHVLAHLASFMGYQVTLETRAGSALVNALAALEQGDCLVAISFWRQMKHDVLAAEYCRKRGIVTVAIADSAFSPLARVAEHTLIVPTETISFFQSVTTAISGVYGILAELQRLGGQRVDEAMATAEALFQELDVLSS